MQDELNQLNITNGSTSENGTVKEYKAVAEASSAAESKPVAETTKRQRASTKLSKFVSKTIALAGVITVAAAVSVSVAAAEPAETVAEPVPAAPVATITDLNVSFYDSDSNYVILEFTLTDEQEEIEDYSAYILDSNGLQSDCLFENDGSLYYAYIDLAEGTDVTNSLTFVFNVKTYDGWQGELYREEFTLPEKVIIPDPTATITDLNVSFYDSDSNFVILEFTLTDEQEEIEDYSAYILDSNGLQSDCLFENDGSLYYAYIDLAEGTDVANSLTFVFNATTYDGWQGELYREEFTLPEKPTLMLTYVGLESYYSITDAVGDVSVYMDYGTDYPGVISENISGFIVYFEDEDGTAYDCTVTRPEGGMMIAEVTLPVDVVPSFDIYGRLTLVIKAVTTDGWQGTVYSNIELVAIDGYITIPEISSVSITNTVEDNGSGGYVNYVGIVVDTYDPYFIWSDLWLSVTDANGQEYSVQLMPENSDIGYEEYTDGEGNVCGYTYYISYVPEEFTTDEYSCVYVLITATWCEPTETGENIYDSDVYDYDVYVTVN